MKKAKKKDGVIRPFLFGYERSGWGVWGLPTARVCLQTAPPMVVYKCALRESKGIEPRRAKETFRSFSKMSIEFLFGKKETKTIGDLEKKPSARPHVSFGERQKYQ